MSDEYIKTNDVVNAINVLLDNVDASEDAMHKFCDSMNDIQKVEIVRCEDCKHFEAINNDDHGWCKMISDLPCGISVRYGDDYCSNGERADT